MKKVYLKMYNSVIECVKESNIFGGLKKTCLGCCRIEEICNKDNDTGLKEEGGIEMSTTVAFHIRDARSPSFFVFTYLLVTSIFCSRASIILFLLKCDFVVI